MSWRVELLLTAVVHCAERVWIWLSMFDELVRDLRHCCQRSNEPCMLGN